MSTLKVNSIQAANAGSEDYFLARAWVNFNGQGTVAIRQDGNVSSITDNGTGNYTVNFSTSIVDANYSFIGHTPTNIGSFSYGFMGHPNTGQYTTSSVSTFTLTGGGSATDYSCVVAGVLR